MIRYQTGIFLVSPEYGRKIGRSRHAWTPCGPEEGGGFAYKCIVIVFGHNRTGRCFLEVE